MSDTLRLIGGTRDGERIEYRGREAMLPARTPAPSYLDFDVDIAAEAMVAYDTYRLVTRAHCNRNGCVERTDAYVHDSISDKDAAKRIDAIMGWAS